MVPPGRDPQFVLEHSGFVRQLVRRLVFDPELARDVEQETWLAALKHGGPAQGSERSWLATIARNLARRAWRTKARRDERELDPPSPPSTPTPAEILEREALRREVVETLLALEEPWRETLVLHFLEELPLQVIAGRMGVPFETARTRTKRGLELLRARLERRTHLHGVALSLALVEAWRIAPPPLAAVAASVTSLSIGAVLMSTATKTLVAAAAVLALVLAYRFGLQSDPATPTELEAATDNAASLRIPAEDVPQVPSEGTLRSELAPEVASASVTEVTPAAQHGTLLVRTVWSADGKPAAGIGFDLHPSGAEDFYRDSTRHETDARGLARIERVPAGKVLVWGNRGEPVRGEVRAGEESEVELRLPPGFTLKGRVLDFDLAPVANAEVFLWPCVNDPDQGWVMAISDANGAYSVSGLETGINFLSARAAGRAPTVQRLVMSNEGATVEVDLVFEERGGAIVGRVLDPKGAPVADAVVVLGGEEGFGLRRLPDGTEGRAPAGQRRITAADGTFACEGVAAGSMAVVARGRGLAPWHGTVEILAGRQSDLEIRLTQGARIEGVVRDATGKPVERAEVEVDSVASLSGSYRRTKADGKFTLAGLTPGEIELRVEHEKFGATKSKLTVADGATGQVEIVLARGLSLKVRIEGPSEDWVGGYVRATGTQADGRGYWRSERIDADGTVEFEGCPTEPMELELYAPGDSTVPRAALKGVLASVGEVVLQPDPARLGNIRLVGRVVDALGAPVESAKIVPSMRGLLTAPIGECDSRSGRFELGPYAPGEWSVRVRETGFVEVRTPTVEIAAGATHDFGDIVLQRGGSIRLVSQLTPQEVAAHFESAAGATHVLYAFQNEWFSGWIPAGLGWLVTGGGEVALNAQRVDVLVGETIEVRQPVRRVEPRRLKLADANAGSATELEVRDANGVLLGSFAFGGEDGLARVPLAAGRYELRVLAGADELGRRTLEVSDERSTEPIELALD
jgi:RNA polymerase sigma-70 factor (ECF subfamily)